MLQSIIVCETVLMTIFNESFKLGSFWSEILIKKGWFDGFWSRRENNKIILKYLIDGEEERKITANNKKASEKPQPQLNVQEDHW